MKTDYTPSPAPEDRRSDNAEMEFPGEYRDRDGLDIWGEPPGWREMWRKIESLKTARKGQKL